MINPRGALSVCTNCNWCLSKGYPAISSETVLQGAIGKEFLKLSLNCRDVGQMTCTLTLLATKIEPSLYFQEIVVRISEQSFMCEGAVKSWHVGRCFCAARLQVADLWSVVNQTFGASGVFWICSSVQLFWGI